MTSKHEGSPPDLRKLVRPWALVWGLPGLEHRLRISFSARLSRSLGRCTPRTGRIALHRALCTASNSRVSEVLCHEAAHVAAYELFGRTARPHGPEWAALVTAAGFQPKRKTADPNTLTPKLSHPPSKLFEHLCPVCQVTWLARRRMSRWRCTYCLADGLAGELVITERTTSD